ncbi:MAG: PhnD/SsuA/transferrin family substrate-binding protein [Nitrospirae bacterium]|nr:PhnD/SsuA/transferrin family substrate-binding protein [Nitrospirota bacterium]
MVRIRQTAAMASILSLAISGCERGDAPTKVRLWALAPPEVTPLYEEGLSPLRFAVALMISPQEGFTIYGELAEYLGKKLNRPVQLILRRTSSEVNDLVRNRHVEAAILCDYGYAQGRKDFGLQALAVPQVRGRIFHPSYLIVAAESEVESFEQLTDKVSAFAVPQCSRGGLSPPWEAGLPPKASIEKQRVIFGHDRAIKAVAEKLVEAAVVDGMTYEQAALKHAEDTEKTKVIGRSAPYQTPRIAVHPRLDRRLKNELQRLFLTMHEDEDGKKLLQKLTVDRFVMPEGGTDSSMRGKAGGPQ